MYEAPREERMGVRMGLPPEGGWTPIEAPGELVRTVKLRLWPDKETEEKLKQLCLLSANLWNEINYERRKLWEEGRLNRETMKMTYDKYYEKYSAVIGANTAQQILNKNNETWRTFFALLKAKKEGKLPFVTRVNPPGCGKRRKKRQLWTVLCNRQYIIEDGFVLIKWLGRFDRLRVRYTGVVPYRGKQGRAELRYDEDEKKWYLLVPIKAEEKLEDDIWVKVPREPRGNMSAGIDIGLNNLIAAYVEDGKALLVSGRPLKSISFYWQRKIAREQCKLNKHGQKTSRKLRRMYKRWRVQIKDYINWAVRNMMEWLYLQGVAKIAVGCPKYIAQDRNGNNNKLNFERIHVWSYGYLLRRLAEVAAEYGIDVEFVDEAYTSVTCPICGVHDEKHARIERGLFKCFVHNKVFNADLVGAFNILKKIKPDITPSPALTGGVGVTRLRPGAGLNPLGM